MRCRTDLRGDPQRTGRTRRSILRKAYVLSVPSQERTAAPADRLTADCKQASDGPEAQPRVAPQRGPIGKLDDADHLRMAAPPKELGRPIKRGAMDPLPSVTGYRIRLVQVNGIWRQVEIGAETVLWFDGFDRKPGIIGETLTVESGEAKIAAGSQSRGQRGVQIVARVDRRVSHVGTADKTIIQLQHRLVRQLNRRQVQSQHVRNLNRDESPRHAVGPFRTVRAYPGCRPDEIDVHGSFVFLEDSAKPGETLGASVPRLRFGLLLVCASGFYWYSRASAIQRKL